MANTKEIHTPDLGGEAKITAILVKAGDVITEETPILEVESDKATMEIPSPHAGTVKSITVKQGDSIAHGHLLMNIEMAAEEGTTKPQAAPAGDKKSAASTPEKTVSSTVDKEVVIPDIGTADAVPVIEIHVKVGDQVEIDSPLLTLESDKATMDLPAPFAGVVKEVKVKLQDKVKQQDVVVIITAQEAVKNIPQAAVTKTPETDTAVKVETPTEKPITSTNNNSPVPTSNADIHAGPAVRKIAREFGVNLALVKGSGQKQRIMKEDVQAFVKAQLQNPSTGATGLPQAPVVDFSKFGAIETQALSRIKKLSGKFLHRNWLLVPHVTQFIDADITDMEEFRQTQKSVAEKHGVKITPLVFIMKAIVSALKEFPQFNASLDASGENLILKKYFHIGVAVDTPDGLVVPVIRDVDQKTIIELAAELAQISEKARKKQLTSTEMQGGCFSISSLGGIGGTAFTPIVNVPEVAILGVSKAAYKPVYQDKQFVPRLMLPLSLSYDHRVIDGADGARFAVHVAKMLTDIRGLLL